MSIILRSNKSRTFPLGIRPSGKDYYSPSFPRQATGYSGKVRDKKRAILLSLWAVEALEVFGQMFNEPWPEIARAKRHWEPLLDACLPDAS